MTTEMASTCRQIAREMRAKELFDDFLALLNEFDKSHTLLIETTEYHLLEENNARTTRKL